jgi:hypothetical protein
MAIKNGKLVASKKTILFREVEALKITSRELRLTYDRAIKMTGIIHITELVSGVSWKHIIIIESFIKTGDRKSKLTSVKSLVEFHKEKNGRLWLPMILKLKIGNRAYLHFRTKIKRDGGYRYKVEGPVDPSNV